MGETMGKKCLGEVTYYYNENDYVWLSEETRLKLLGVIDRLYPNRDVSMDRFVETHNPVGAYTDNKRDEDFGSVAWKVFIEGDLGNV